MVTLYTTHCPRCNILVKKLIAANIEFEECEDVEIMKEKGFTNLPVLYANNKYYNYKDAADAINRGEIN